MNKECIYFLLLLMVFSPGLFAAEDPNCAYTPTSGYEFRTIEGWSVRINKGLLDEHPELAKKTVELLSFQLYQITRVVPAKPLEKLRQIPIWVDYKNKYPCMCYHPHEDWLIENCYNPEKRGSVEISNAENFLTWTLQQPWMVLHELSHGYHHLVLSYDNEQIRTAYDNAKKNKLYDSVLHYSGSYKKAYAIKNDQEYFAEATEAYFGTNDYYPFVKAELRDHDPNFFKVMEQIWSD